MNPHWTKQQTTEFLASPSTAGRVKGLLVEWLAGDRADCYQRDLEQPEAPGTGTYLEIQGSGQARSARLICGEIMTPDGGDLFAVWISAALDQASDLGQALMWIVQDSGQFSPVSAQRETLHQPTWPMGFDWRAKFVSQRIAGDTADERIQNAPAVIASVWLRSYERLWARYEPAWTDVAADEMSVELGRAAAAILVPQIRRVP